MGKKATNARIILKFESSSSCHSERARNWGLEVIWNLNFLPRMHEYYLFFCLVFWLLILKSLDFGLLATNARILFILLSCLLALS